MYDVIKKISKIFHKKTQFSNNVDDLQICLTINIDEEKVSCDIKTPIVNTIDNYEIVMNRCEKIAFFLSMIANKNEYLGSIIVDNIKEQKKISTEHTLYYNNILFFWQQYIKFKTEMESNTIEPLIRPTRAFARSQMAEDKT